MKSNFQPLLEIIYIQSYNTDAFLSLLSSGIILLKNLYLTLQQENCWRTVLSSKGPALLEAQHKIVFAPCTLYSHSRFVITGIQRTRHG